MFAEVIELIKVKQERNKSGGMDNEITGRNELFADIKSVRGSEFYQAHQAGMEIKITFVVYKDEYDEERVIHYGDKYYTVRRTYETGDFVELSCETRRGLFEELRV